MILPFKQNMTFETLFSNNLSYGSAATKDGGGTIKFRREADNKYVFNGGGSLWVSALKKTPEEFGVLEQDIKKFIATVRYRTGDTFI